MMEQSTGTFLYQNCMDRTYDNTEKVVASVCFSISRYGNYEKIIRFSKPVTEERAIRRAEKYLSKPLTRKYYEQIKDDLFHGADWEDIKDEYSCRGDCLTDACYLEDTDITSDGELTFFIGT